MENGLLVLTKETTMWKAWIGFNASHSLGMILFGVIYGYLALAQRPLLFRSRFLLLSGLMMLTAYAYLCRHYFFSDPFRMVVLAGILYFTVIKIEFNGGHEKPIGTQVSSMTRWR
jgi:hypothetical protein